VEVGGIKKNQCKWSKGQFTKSKSSSTSTLALRKLFQVHRLQEAIKKLSVDANEANGVSAISNFKYDETRAINF
jgi:hypothetical protein